MIKWFLPFSLEYVLNKKIEEIYDYFVERGLLDELQFKRDIFSYCHNNKGNIQEKQLNIIMGEHVENLKNMGLYCMSINYINGLEDQVDKILGDEKIKLYDIYFLVVVRLDSIIKEYTQNSYIADDKPGNDKNLRGIVILNLYDEIKKNIIIKNKLLRIVKNKIDIDIRISAATLVETYMWHVGLNNHREWVECHIEMGFKLDKDSIIRLKEVYDYLFNILEKRKEYHKGIPDTKKDTVGKKEKALSNTLNRLKYLLKEASETDDKCLEALKNITCNYDINDILMLLNKTNFNYMDHAHESYEMFERLIELVVHMRNKQQNKESKNRLKKLIKYQNEYSEICNFFDEDKTIWNIPESIEQHVNIPINQVFSYAITIFMNYYGMSENNIRQILKFLFSKAKSLDDTNFAKKIYTDLELFIINDGAFECYKTRMLYPLYIFKDEIEEGII